MIAYQSDKTAQERMREFLERDFFVSGRVSVHFRPISSQSISRL